MWTQIRLADRRGLLTGDLSPVQEGAIHILMGREAVEQVRDILRRAAPQTDEEEDDYYEDEEFEDSGTWIMPDFDPHEAEKLMAQMGQGGTLRLGDLE